VKKTRVAVVYGGRSGEHEVSLISAASVIDNLDQNRFEIVPVGIDKAGKWHLGDQKQIQSGGKVKSLPSPTGQELAPQAATGKVDVVFPVMHGPFCEDGSIQGLLELADIPYVGAGILGSAIGMDKEVAKRLVEAAGLPVVPYVTFKKGEWNKRSDHFIEQIKKKLGYPCFVKPVNMGSSVGVHKVKDPGALRAAIEDALRYDLKILVEKAINAREIEFSVLENPEYGEPPLVSVAGEITPKHEFYSYEAKYLDDAGADLMIPARLNAEQMAEGQNLARSIFQILEGEGMARVDLFVDRDTGKFYFNEVNTIPGFTHISMYPKMWAASGIPYQELLTRLIDLAIARHRRKAALSHDRT
jgi:D-alanine-D-alanine ligase